MIYFVSGIDTDAGKSYATAYLAREWNKKGIKTITQKFIQTGNIGRSEDIELHRKIMGCGPLPEDSIPTSSIYVAGNSTDPSTQTLKTENNRVEEPYSTLTAPEVFSYPASPLLASAIDKRPIDFAKIEAATAELDRRYERVLVEGAGGLMVPLTNTTPRVTIDYIAAKKYPLVFVSSGKLGSVNHTLLSLEAIKNRGIELTHFCYNLYPQPQDTTIQQDTKQYLKDFIASHFSEALFIEIPIL